MSEAPPSVVVLVYDGVAADEASVVVQIVAGAGIDVTMATVGSGPVTSYRGRIPATVGAAELAGCNALVVPGGMGVRRAAADPALAAAIRRLAAEATWLGATSTGSVLLAAAGVVGGARATTHWLAGELLVDHGLELVNETFVEHGRLLTASGSASAARLAFRLVGALAGVDAEERARSSFRPRAGADPRYAAGRRPRRWPPWRAGSERRSTARSDDAPEWSTGAAEDRNVGASATRRSRLAWFGRWRAGRQRVTSNTDRIDPDGQATVVVLDLIDPDGPGDPS